MCILQLTYSKIHVLSELKIIDLILFFFYFIFLDLELGVIMMSYITVTIEHGKSSRRNDITIAYLL